MTAKPKPRSLWSGLLFVILLAAVSLVAQKTFQSAAPGALNDTGKNGMYLFKRMMAERGIHIEPYHMGNTPDVSSESMGVSSENMGAVGERIIIHLLPYQSGQFNKLNLEAIEERRSQLNALMTQSDAKGVTHKLYLIDFEHRQDRDVYTESFYDANTLNGYVLQNKNIPFERALLDRIIEKIEQGIEQEIEAKAPKVHVRWLYHDDVLVTQQTMSHWLLVMPSWFQWGAVQILVICGIYFLAVGRTLGFPLKDKGEDEPTPMTFVKASAAYFKRHQLHAMTLELYYQRLARLRTGQDFKEQTPPDASVQHSENSGLTKRLKALDALRAKGWTNARGKVIHGKSFYRELRNIEGLTRILKEMRKNKWRQM